ncbi:MAG: hypothetical protein M9939_17020 [Mesorhizobium sp.]|nr:hypothetical protein [Mesorhizobium sp.]MCO5162838.1 hypothetical protein [Mesorhizobium sp.]
MNKFLLASVAVLGLAGSAVAQEVPAFYGQNPYASTVDHSKPQRQTVTGQASAKVTDSGASTSGASTKGFNIHLNQNYSGK